MQNKNTYNANLENMCTHKKNPESNVYRVKLKFP